jgi:hypothetical protein
MFDNTLEVFGTNPYITTNLDEWDSYDVTGDINIFNDLKTSRWQVYNTHIRSSNNAGYMGYYETSTQYPLIDTCNDDPLTYWGEDYWGNEIEPLVTNIRHHRMPSYLKPSGADFSALRLGIKFHMSEDYPHERIVGHYYVFGDRTEERTIVDKGFITTLGDAGNDNYLFKYNIYPGGANAVPSKELYAYISPEVTFEGRTVSGDYLTVEKAYDGGDNMIATSNALVVANDIYEQPINVWAVQQVFRNFNEPVELNYKLKEAVYLAKSPTEKLPNYVYAHNEVATVENRSIHTNVMLYQIERPFKEVDDWADDFYSYGGSGGTPSNGARTLHVSVKRDIDVFANLFVVQYKRIGSSFLNRSGLSGDYEQLHYEGDSFVTYFSVFDST